MSFYKHETAIIDPGAELGVGCKVWHWVHICGGAQIGPGSVFGQNVFVGNKVRIGANCKIQNNVSIYDNVVLEDDVFCGPSMVFTNVINPRSQFVRKDEYLTTQVRKGATIGANATIVCGVELGEYCFVAAGAVVNKNVPPFALVAGVPAKPIGWMSRFGERIPLESDGSWACPTTGDVYSLQSGAMSLRMKGA